MPGRYFSFYGDKLYGGSSGQVQFRKIQGFVAPPNPGSVIAAPNPFLILANAPHGTVVVTLAIIGFDAGYTYSNWRLTSGTFTKLITANITATTCQFVVNDANGLDNSDAGDKTEEFAVDYSGQESGTLTCTVTGVIQSVPGTPVWTSTVLTDPSYSAVVKMLPQPSPTTQRKITGVNNVVYDGRDRTYLSQYLGEYPLEINTWSSGAMTGVRVIGTQPRDRLWRSLKGNNPGPNFKQDHDAARILMGGNGGTIICEGCWFDNIMDGFRPKYGANAYLNGHFIFRHCYMRYIRDDCVENDECARATIEDCLIDGCYMFSAERPGDPDGSGPLKPVCPSPQQPTTINRCVVEFEPMPYESNNPFFNNQKIHKSGTNNGPVIINDSRFLFVQPPTGGGDEPTGLINVPSGGSGNVIHWMGRAQWGNFPIDGSLPSGWTIVETRTAFDAARTAWLEAHGDFTGTGDDFPWLHE